MDKEAEAHGITKSQTGLVTNAFGVNTWKGDGNMSGQKGSSQRCRPSDSCKLIALGSSRVKVVHPGGPELSQDGQVYIPSMDVSCTVKGMTWVRQLSAVRSVLEGPDS